MEYILYFFRFLYRVRWWLICGTILITLLVLFATRNMRRTYKVEATIYTGIVSGYSIEGSGNLDWAATNNAIDNLINIMRAESTLKRVSYRLYARNMINGNLEKDNHFLTAANFREIYNHTKSSKDGKQLLALIDKNSEEKTVQNMLRYERPTPDNYIYGLFYWNHKHYSYQTLKNIQIKRQGSSDLLEVSYTSDDPGITYNTIDILMEEFINEYRAIRYGETDKVIEYFKRELGRIERELTTAEDSLTQYNIEKRVINYYDETKEIAAINKEFELREQTILSSYNSSRAMLEELEKQLESNLLQLKTNAEFINKLNEASSLTGKITELESFSTGSEELNTERINSYKDQLTNAKDALGKLSDNYVENLHTKEGLAKSTIVDQWLEQLLLFEKAKAELEVIQKSRQDLNDKYVFFAPVGSTIKRKERKIDFTERNYLDVHRSYNEALMRRKNLEMTSATIKVLNPPAFPISAEPTARKRIIIVAFVASLLFILGFFLLIELLDRTLRDKLRAERVTGEKVLGAIPGKPSPKYKHYYNKYLEIAIQYLSNIVLSFFKEKNTKEPYIINILSTESGDGKSFIASKLEDHWTNMGLKVKRISWQNDFDVNDRNYLLANSIQDIYQFNDEDIIITEYPNLKEYTIPNKLAEEATINLLIARANRAWKESDKLSLNKLKEQVSKAPICFYLNNTSIQVTETFTGMLPPYTYLRKLSYRISQLGLTERPSKESEIQNENI